MEDWRKIIGYENYEISTLGRVRSLDRVGKRTLTTTRRLRGKILKPFPVNGGYLCVYLSNKEGIKSFKVHRLVAIHYVQNENHKPEVNHINGNRQCNTVDNLEWCTKSENAIHSYSKLGRVSLLKGKTGAMCVNSKKVCQYSVSGLLIKVWDSLSEVNKHLGIAGTNISRCCNGEFKTMGGYKWQFLK